MLASNITLPFPLPAPLGFYADVSYAPISISGTYQTNTNFVGGIYFQLIKNVAYFYVPLTQSSDVQSFWENNLNNNNILTRTSFVLNLNLANPINLIRNLSF